jgi:hypothetical protein
MAWISTKRLGHLDTSATTADGSKIERTASEYYLVRYDAPATATEAERASGVPDLGATSTGDIARRFKSKSSKMVDESARSEWLVQVDFSTLAPEAPEENPIDRPDEISWDFEDSSQPYFTDYDPAGPKPVVNAAGEPFEQFLERETGSITATVRRYVAYDDYDPAQAILYKDAINAGSFTLDGKTIGAGQAKMGGIPAGPRQTVTIAETEIHYREVTFKLKFRRTWSDLIDARGYNELGDDGKLTPIYQSETDPSLPPKPVDKPYPLDVDGHALPNPTDAPFEHEFFPYDEQDFSVFGFS